VGPIVPGRVTEKQAQALRALVATGQISYADVEKVMPTYTGYVWNDTGTTVKTATGIAKLLAPQPSFTLFVSHDGPLVGWKHALSGVAGVTITEISRNFYRLSVGSSGSAEVLTSIEALERAPTTEWPQWIIWLIILIAILILLLVVIRILKRRPPPPPSP
jgi:hypothetical protein